MAKYNLLMIEEEKIYTLQDDIKELENIHSDFYRNYLFVNMHKEIMNYLNEEPSKIIMLAEKEMQNQEDFDVFCKKYCPFKGTKQTLINRDFLYNIFEGENKDGKKYVIICGNNGLKYIFFTENFLNKYINGKEM